MKHFHQPHLIRLLCASLKKPAAAARWLLTLVVCLMAAQAGATTYYVSATGTNGNGLSWGAAKTQLNVAIGLAVSGDQIWIKAGTYSAQGGFPANVQNYSFYMKSGVKVYGGFAGTEPSNFNLANRNLTANVTNLVRTSGNNYPVVYYANTNNTTMLDGVTISGGAANYTNPDFAENNNSGGGIMIHSASPIISNVIFNNNTAGARGGAVHCYLSYPTFTNVTFTNNSAAEGGAICVYGFGPSITNATFTNNTASNFGGALFIRGTAEGVAITNALFTNNKSGYSNGTFNNTTGSGGAIRTDYANCYINKVVFENNRAGGNGGAIYNSNTLATSDNTRTNQVTNTVFINNGTYAGFGGGISNDGSSGTVANCTFYNNYCGASATGGGGIYTAKTSASGPAITSTIANCVFSNNVQAFTNGNPVVQNDVARNNQASVGITYSSFLERPSYGSSSNNIDRVAAPFVNAGLPAGPDGVWMTADDGMQLSVCSSSLIDKGNNDAITFTADVAGQPRKRDVGLVADGGFGSAPIIDLGAYESQNTATIISITGSIGNAHTIPYPQEIFPDSVKNVVSPPAGTTIKWQKLELGSSTWVDATPQSNALDYVIPTLTRTTSFRRVAMSATYCNAPFYTDSVTIRVANPTSTQAGTIQGKVSSKNGVGVQGIAIRVTRQTAISGSPAGYTYTDTTDGAGEYRISPVYYGDLDDLNASASFTVTPLKANHGFNPSSLIKTVSYNDPKPTNANFTDTTVLSITGRTFQECTTCNTVSGATETQNCPIDSINIYKDNAYATATRFIDGEYGRYSLSVTDPIQVTIEPRLTGHTFTPAFTSVTPTDNVAGVDFKDVTTHTISGRLIAGAGCTTNNFIGTAVLEFTDVLSRNADSSLRNSCFRKRVTTNVNSGTYTITLPARKYRVQVISFTPAFSSTSPAYVSADSVIKFMNSQVPTDSLTRDISFKDTTLNLVYVRPPVIGMVGLNPVCTTPREFSLIRQAATDSFKVFVYQGPQSLGCPLSDTSKIRIITNVQQEDQDEEFRFAAADTGIRVRLKGGIPNIVPNDYLKDIAIYFTDKYGRNAAGFTRKVLVTGVKSDAATYTTVSPEVPMVVLHDPPGDGSYSTWQTSQSITNAIRFYTATGVGVEAWAEAKVGVQTTVGIGVATDISLWGTIRGSIGVNATVTPSNEAILTTTTTSAFSTSADPEVNGDNGDVYIGAALNLKYAVATEIGFNNCSITSGRRLMIANSGFATQYIYTQEFILNTLIPGLQGLAQIHPDSAARYLNQVKVWQQVIDNNAENKRRAAFVQNWSFDGAAGPYTNTTTTSSTKVSTLEFAVDVNASVAAELGFDISGTGASGGVSVNFKVETGGSESNTVTNETSIGYTLDDNTIGDYFSVNVKKDPVYNTPVFELAAGTASCPIEPGAQPRDAVFFTAVNRVIQNVPAGDFANFNLKIVNTSPSSQTNVNDTRTYKLAYVQGSNVANETIQIAGAAYQSGSPFVLSPLGYLDSVIVPVSIKRQTGSPVFTYEGEQFIILNSCDEDLGKTVQVSAYYTAPCSSITLSQPIDGWQLNSSNNNLIFIRATGYTLANLTSVELEYSTAGGNSWTPGPSLDANALANGFNWNVAGLADGAYNLRLRLVCAGGVVYSPRVTGFIDRKAPTLFGRPTPTDDRFVSGDVISFTYNEKLNTNPSNLQVTVRRLSNGQLLPATASIFENKIIIAPTNSITGFTGDSIRVIVAGVSDVYGNVKAMPDTSRFTVGTTVAGTGNQALTVSATNPVVFKNGDTAINILFNLPVNATSDTRVNYTISGTARYGIDYTVSYPTVSALYANFNGATGSIKIAGGSRQALLRIIPMGNDTALTPNKTVIITISEGGDYSIGATNSITGILTSEDGINVYTFNGNGAWNNRDNWLNRKMPLSTLVTGKEIIISPVFVCELNIAQTLRPGSRLTVKQNRQFVIQGSLRQQ